MLDIFDTPIDELEFLLLSLYAKVDKLERELSWLQLLTLYQASSPEELQDLDEEVRRQIEQTVILGVRERVFGDTQK